MLLTHGMFAGISSRSTFVMSALARALVAILLVASTASAQTGTSTARLTDQQGEFTQAGIQPEHLSHLDGQPHLKGHLARINEFRTLFHTQRRRPLRQRTASPPQGLVPVSRVARLMPRPKPVAGSDATDLAILELQESLSARQYPSWLYPGVGLVFALETISKWSEQSMISALRTGAVPIYSQSGEVIGVEDADTGRLLGGRRS